MDETCPICLHAQADFRLECGHEFHSACLVPWFRSGRDFCPTCRARPVQHEEESESLSHGRLLVLVAALALTSVASACAGGFVGFFVGRFLRSCVS